MINRCQKCVLPKTVPNITFDENGVCHYCSAYDRNEDTLVTIRKDDEINLKKKMESARIRRKQGVSKYDVLTPLSGGRDSTYVAWLLSKQQNLKVLCVHYDNPFSSVQAMKNVKTVVKNLGLDLITFKWPNKRHEKSFKTNLKAWLKKPDLGTTGLLCLACKPFYLKFFQIAHEHNIQLIIDGSNPNEDTQFKTEARQGKSKEKVSQLNKICIMGQKVSKNFDYIRHTNFIPAIHTLMSLNGGTKYLRWKYPNITKHGYFYSFPYNEKEINSVLETIGWEKATDNASPWRFDCEIDSLKNYFFQKMIQATEKEDLFSKNIRAGLMTREEALSRLNEAEINFDIISRVLSKIQMDVSDLDAFHNNSKK